MNVLIVYTHPIKDSFNRKILDAVEQALTEVGHAVRVADLYAEEFEPAMTPGDFAAFENLPMPPEIQAEQARVEWSDAMVFIFPIWWWSLPGMLKGWIDRVMSYGFAWVDPKDPDSGHLRHRKLLVLTTAGDSAKAFAKRGYDTSFHTQLNVGTWNFCGFKDVTTRIFHGIHPKPQEELRAAYLEEARALALELVR
jgi:NAD(P)H dehydrogenase (quinone)